jgi:hypothetical protein
MQRLAPCLLALLVTPALAIADPEPVTIDEPPAHRSHLIPAMESAVMVISLQLGAQAIGQPWADISTSTMWRNVSGGWVWDEDPFTIDQFGHPYGGAYPFLAARSMGHGFWTSYAYAFGASLAWETLMENEPPSLNDQITTPIAGALIGESLHRIGRALRTGRPTLARAVAAAVLDPVGAFNREVWGRAWRDELPPSYYAHAGLGWDRLTRRYGDRVAADHNQLHAELVLQHGLPGDPDAVPRRPLDHFELRAALDVAREHVVGTLHVRGLLLGQRLAWERVSGLWGLYGSYDFLNPDRTRVSAIGIGPGIATELALTPDTYARATGVLSLIPWGAAGGSTEGEKAERDYHRGPGAGQLVELELGWRRRGNLRLSSRAWEIDGTLIGDGRELVTTHTLAARASLSASHAVGVEGTYALRGVKFTSDVMSLLDRSAEVRVFYALTSGAI